MPPPSSTKLVKGEDDPDCDVHFKSESFGSEVVHHLAHAGYCVVGSGIDRDTLVNAEREAKLIENFEPPPALVVEGLLGPEGSTEIASLDPPDLDAADRTDGDSLQQLDGFMTNVAASVEAFLESELGFVCGQRTQGLLHVASESGGDEPAELTEKECGRWLGIFRRHRIMCVLCLGLKGGTLVLRPFDDESEQYKVPLKFGQMAVFRADALGHSYQGGTSKDIVLSCWLLGPDRSGVRGAFQECWASMPLVPAYLSLAEWSAARIMNNKSNRGNDQGSLHDQDIPRNWKLWEAHNSSLGVQCALRGMAVNLPVRCESEDSIAAPMMNGTDFAIEVPFKRWEHFMPGDGNYLTGNYDPEPGVHRQNRFKTNIRHGTFIEGQDLFDNKHFNMSMMESKVTDPCQRLALESAYQALYTAGYVKKSLMQAFIGVYQGHTASDWDKIEHEVAGGCAGSYSPTIASNRVSFSLGIMGPSFTIDVEGASALAAIYQGAHDIIPSGDWRKPPTTGSVCGGVTVQMSTYWWPVHNNFMCILGRCLTFDTGASGYIKGEGVCTAVLKRNGELVEGKVVPDETKPNICIISGWSMINSGANAGLSAPSGPSLQKVIMDSVKNALLDPLDVDAVECHGAGNFLFDATEASCLAKCLRGHDTQSEERIAITSSKSKFGYCQESSGIASFFSAVATQRLGSIPPNVHLKTLNEYIDDGDCELLVPTESANYRLSSSFCGVNAYGFGGTNVNTLLWAEIDDGKFPAQTVELDRQVFQFWPGGGGQLEDDMQPARGYFIVGSWTQWEVPERMKTEDGCHTVVVTLGPNRYEHFRIMLDGDDSKTLHPGVPGAPSTAPLLGPVPIEDCPECHWAIDGRTWLEAQPSGPSGLRFTPHTGSIAAGGDLLEKLMTVDEAKAMCETLPLCRGFCYQGAPDAEGQVRVVFKSKWEPTDKAEWTAYHVEEAKGDEIESLEYFKVGTRDVGMPGDQYRVKLEVAGKWKAVSWDRVGKGTGTVEDGDYYLLAGWNDWELCKMERVGPGQYRLDVTPPGSRWAKTVRAEFQIVRNKDFQQTFCPADALSVVGKADGVSGPGEVGGLNWQLEGEPGTTFRIDFERTVEGEVDTKRLSWRPLKELADA